MDGAYFCPSFFSLKGGRLTLNLVINLGVILELSMNWLICFHDSWCLTLYSIITLPLKYHVFKNDPFTIIYFKKSSNLYLNFS